MRLYGNIEERLLVRLKFSDGCWEWTGCLNSDGYGRVRIGGVSQFVHRAVIEWVIGRKLKRLEIVDHLCRNHACARPSHLEVVTPSENTRRGWAARLSTEAAEALRRQRAKGMTFMQLSRKFGVHYTTAIRICNGRVPKYLRYDHGLHQKNAKATRAAKRLKAELDAGQQFLFRDRL